MKLAYLAFDINILSCKFKVTRSNKYSTEYVHFTSEVSKCYIYCLPHLGLYRNKPSSLLWNLSDMPSCLSGDFIVQIYSSCVLYLGLVCSDVPFWSPCFHFQFFVCSPWFVSYVIVLLFPCTVFPRLYIQL